MASLPTVFDMLCWGEAEDIHRNLERADCLKAGGDDRATVVAAIQDGIAAFLQHREKTNGDTGPTTRQGTFVHRVLDKAGLLGPSARKYSKIWFTRELAGAYLSVCPSCGWETVQWVARCHICGTNLSEGNSSMTEASKTPPGGASNPGGPSLTALSRRAGGPELPSVGWLVVMEGPGQGTSFALGNGRNSIGTAPEADLRLDFAATAEQAVQASVLYDHRHRKFYLQPEHGAEMLRLGDDVVLEPVELAGGEAFSVGATQLRFVPFCGPDFDWNDI